MHSCLFLCLYLSNALGAKCDSHSISITDFDNTCHNNITISFYELNVACLLWDIIQLSRFMW